MDVRCSRCGTEYDFDDALVSERGTTVKCTNCGHQFKVYPGGGGGAPERWIVRKNSGRELVYTSLRDLQRAIAQRQVGPADLLSRGGGHPLRALGAIAELEPFFHAHNPAGAPNEAAQRTLLGTGDKIPEQRAPEPPPRAPRAEPPRQPHIGAQTQLGIGGVIPKRDVPRAPPKSSPLASGSDPFAAYDQEPVTAPRQVPPVAPSPIPGAGYEAHGGYHDSNAGYRAPSSDYSQPSSFERADTAHEPPSPEYAETFGEPPPAPNAQMDGITASFRQYQDSFSDESFPSGVPNQRPLLKWLVGVVVVGALAFIAGTVGMKYARKMSAVTPATSAPANDPRVTKLVEDGEALLVKGDFDGAKEQADKASVLADKDPTVLSLAARNEASRAGAP
ncbi:MAG TPA: zinc-ribbon domain-containing protein, partial [Polyangiaceae bacterium]|nr:zinc-ribbon domain-containing protein [Polyangiaceae bacterium]